MKKFTVPQNNLVYGYLKKAFQKYVELHPEKKLDAKRDQKDWFQLILQQRFRVNSTSKLDQFYIPHLMAEMEAKIGDDIKWQLKAQTAAVDYLNAATRTKRSKEYIEAISRSVFKREIPLESHTIAQLDALVPKLKIDAKRN
jgi:hypothetical protein